MKTLRILLFTLFIAVVAVDGQPSACVVWNPVYRDDTHGHLHAASTVWDCWNSCLSTGMCFRFDWNDNAADGKRCLIFDGTPDITRSVFTRECFSNAFGCEVWPSQQNTSFGNGQLDTTVDYGVYPCLAACYLNQSCTGVDWNASAPINQGCWLSGSWSGSRITSPGITHYDYNGTCLAQACVIWTPQRTTNISNGQPNAAWNGADCQKACINNSQCNGIYWNHPQCWLTGPWSGTNITITPDVEHYALNRNCLVQVSPSTFTTTAEPTTTACVVWNPVYQIIFGHLHAASTVWDCWDLCSSSGRCLAFNWNDNAVDGKRCWISSGMHQNITDSVFTRNCLLDAFGCEVWPAQQNTSVGNGQLYTAPYMYSAYNVSYCLAACYLNQSCNGVDWYASAPRGQQCWLSGPWSGPRITSPSVTHYDYNRTCLAQACVIWTPQLKTDISSSQSYDAWDVHECRTACINNSQCNGVDWNYNAYPWCLFSGPWSGTRNLAITPGVERYELNRNCLVQVSPSTFTTTAEPTTTVSPSTFTTTAEPTTTATPVYSVWPLYGPAAGGTRVTISGQFLSVSTVAAVHFGQYRTHPDNSSVVENTLYVTTLPVNATARHLAIELVLNNGLRIDTDHKFEYRPNPVFTDIRPREHITVGGTKVTVYGRNLNSVAVPRITLTVVITRFGDHNITSSKTESSGPCEFPPRNAEGIELVCRMPNASVLDEFVLKQRQKREAGSSYNEGKRGVAVYYDEDGSVRADVYIGFELDGVKRYENISSVDHSVTFTFTTSPNISCQTGQLDFDPSKDKTILITGRHLTRGCSLEDYDIRLGDAVCVPVSLTDNQIDCRPPTNEPKRNSNDTFCDDRLSLQMNIGNYEHHCSCVRYVPQDIAALYIGLSVLLGLLIIVVALIIVTFVVLRRVQTKKQAGQGNVSKDKVQRSTEPNRDNMHHSRRTSDESMGDYNRQLPDECMGESQL